MGLSESWKQAQEAAIGSMLIDPRCVGLVLQGTSEAHFPDATCRNLYRAVRRLWDRQAPIDPVSVGAEVGGPYEQTIRQLFESTPTAANVERYVEILRDSFVLSTYQQAAMELLHCEKVEDAAAVWDRLGKIRMTGEKRQVLTWEQAVGRYLDRMNDSAPPDYLSFGIPELDRLLNVGRGKFVILAANSSSGKTALALQFAYHMAETGKKVGFFSLETDNDTLTDRLMSETQVAGIGLPRTKAKALTEDDYKHAVDAGMKSAGVGLELIDFCETCDEIRTWTIQQGYEVIFVDYLQLVNGDGEADRRWDIVTNTSMQLHRLAQKLGVTVIGLSQVTPKGENKDKELTMEDLRESQQLKHDADIILILNLWKMVKYGRRLAVAKNKDGRRNSGLNLVFDPEHMTFSYYRRTEQQKKERKAAAGQVEFEELDEEEGDDLPF